MPLNNFFYDDEEPAPEPPPYVPPSPPGNIGPPVGPPATQPPGAPPAPPAPFVPPGGGGGGPGMQPPGYPTFNIPGAPQFNPTPFVRPTLEQAQNEPGYRFRLNSGVDALERSKAAQGSLRTGGTLTDVLDYGQNFAAQEYDRVFNREMGAHNLRYRGEYDRFAPEFARWQMRAGGERDAQLARYQAELSRFLQDSAPRGDGGFDYELFNEMFPEQHKIPVEPGGPYYQEGAPDTDPYYY